MLDNPPIPPKPKLVGFNPIELSRERVTSVNPDQALNSFLPLAKSVMIAPFIRAGALSPS